MRTTLEAALELGKAGLHVHPCRPDDKRPLTRWTHTATTDPRRISRLWQRWPDALVAVCTGYDGLVVVDDDRRLTAPDQSLAQTRTSRTRSRGFHHWYQTREPIGCNVGVLAPGIDVRGTNGYVIAPPSPGWEWLNDAPILPLPEPILAALQQHRSTASRLGRGFEARDHVPAGERHAYLLSFAGWLVANELAETFEDVVAETLDHASQVCAPPDSEHSRRQHVEGIARWVLARERGER